jgi:hypothetical protein
LLPIDQSGSRFENVKAPSKTEARMTPEPFRLSSDPAPAKRQQPITAPVELLIEHPFADRRWMLAKARPEPQWFLVCTVEGQVLALHESQFKIVQ